MGRVACDKYGEDCGEAFGGEKGENQLGVAAESRAIGPRDIVKTASLDMTAYWRSKGQ